MKSKLFLIISILTLIGSASGSEIGSHLFILSGQSNMARLDPELSFAPAVRNEYGMDRVIVVHDAHGGQPIHRWYKKWKPVSGEVPEVLGDLYDRLIEKVHAAIEGRSIDSVTFIWMQGERDAREMYGEVYGKSLDGLIGQLGEDLGREDINVVIGRLSDFGFGLKNGQYTHWKMVREAQVALADSSSSIEWVDTDDLNSGLDAKGNEVEDDLHYSVEGYRLFGSRLAEKAIGLVDETRGRGENE